jgi:hypothetical protein
MKFDSGTEQFRDLTKGWNDTHFKKGVPFAGGDKFPLVRGKINTDKKLDVRDYMYAVQDAEE